MLNAKLNGVIHPLFRIDTAVYNSNQHKFGKKICSLAKTMHEDHKRETLNLKLKEQYLINYFRAKSFSNTFIKLQKKYVDLTNYKQNK